MSDAARLLDDTARRLLSRHLDDPARRADPASRRRLLAAFDESGLPLVMAPEAAGGMAAGLQEATALAWRIGWHAAPLPVVPLLLCPALAADGAANDGLRVSLADAAGLRLVGGRLEGGSIEAPATEATEVILAVCMRDDEPCLAEVEARSARRLHTIDGALWLSVDARDAALRAVRPSPIDPARIAILGALITAAAMAGAMARQLEIVIDHANTRRQFGRPIGKFQAVQTLIADAAAEHVLAEAALAGAVAAEDGGRGRPLLWRAAKVQAGRAASIVAAVAHQVLGAMGFTEEHVLHHLSKRLWVWRDDWGRQRSLEIAVGAAAAADERGLWPHIADAPCEERS